MVRADDAGLLLGTQLAVLLPKALKTPQEGALRSLGMLRAVSKHRIEVGCFRLRASFVGDFSQDIADLHKRVFDLVDLILVQDSLLWFV